MTQPFRYNKDSKAQGTEQNCIYDVIAYSGTAFAQILRLGLFSFALNICCTQTE